MRGSDGVQESLFMMAKLDDFVPSDPPLRKIQGGGEHRAVRA